LRTSIFFRKIQSLKRKKLYNIEKLIQLSSFYLDGFRHIIEENFRIFQENSLANFKNSKPECATLYFILYLAKHVYAKFQLSSLYPDGLRQKFYLFSRKIQDFLKENLEFSTSEKSSD
jgi:hypothetical protein